MPSRPESLSFDFLRVAERIRARSFAVSTEAGCPGVAGIESVHARSEETLLPADDGRSGRPQPALNGAERGTLGQHQDQTGAEDVSGRQGTGLGDAAELAPLTLGENYRIGGHTPLDASGPTNVISATVR